MKDLAKGFTFVTIFAVLFIPLIVSDSLFFPYITGKNFWFRMLVELATAGWLVMMLYDVRYRLRFSWFVPAVAALLAIMFLANIFGVHPPTSFWSNYERMDGYVTLVHFVLYFLILGSVLSFKEEEFFGIKISSWQLFLGAALVAAIMVSFSAFKQIAGLEQTTMGWRINGTLGNAAYMAVYMLFNTFVALWFAAHSKGKGWRYAALALSVLFIFLLVQTATRGTIIGLAAGSFVGLLYIAIAHKKYPKVRKIALGGVILVTVLMSALFTFRDTAFVQNNLILQRSSAVSVSELSLRIDIWKIALEGVAERPVLGWGQNNFNYIFNEYYRADFSHRAELWYDRAHNVFMDWLTTGGVLGLLAYLSLFIFAGYYIFFWPRRNREESFDVVEYGLLFGIGAAYFIHNLVVFDNIVSYIYFAIILAMIHSKVAKRIPAVDRLVINNDIATQIITPLIIVVTVTSLYFVNIPSMLAASDVIEGLVAKTVAAKQEAFDLAFSRNSFATQELTEQMAQQALSIAQNQASLPDPDNAPKFLAEAESRLLYLADYKPGDARVHVFLSSFYRGTGQVEKAREQAAIALSLSPHKPAIVMEQGLVEYQAGDYKAMNEFMKKAYELDTKNKDTQIYYALSGLLAGVPGDEAVSVVSDQNWNEFALNNFAYQSAQRASATSTLERILKTRISLATTTPDNYMSLSYVYYSENRTDEAIEVLKEAQTIIPTIKKTTDCYIGNLEKGIEPNTGC